MHAGKGMLMRRALLAALLVSVFVSGCNRAKPTKLMVYCGAGLRPPVAEAVDLFSQQEGIEVECDFAGSEVLFSRVKLSRQGDVYIPGEASYVEQAEEEGLVADRADLCYFVPVILVPKGNPGKVGGIEDFTRDELRIGLGDAGACAVGRVASKIFEKNGIDESTLDVDFRSLTVNELANSVQLGHLDAAIVWDAVASLVADDTEIVRIPPEKNVVSTVPVALLTTSQNPEAARRLFDFLRSAEARAVFEKHHYTVELPQP
ncbi:MAG: extracellular solute-binding protein [Planctomycetota bacterium]|nr:MAG: extracellular solute-binding protein [Planctomycetota bacterium]